MANEKRLIDANALAEKAFTAIGTFYGRVIKADDLYAAPTVEAEPVVHGEWMEDYETFVDDSGQESYPIQTGYVCSECGVDGSPIWRYCPHCGAKMRRMV